MHAAWELKMLDSGGVLSEFWVKNIQLRNVGDTAPCLGQDHMSEFVDSKELLVQKNSCLWP